MRKSGDNADYIRQLTNTLSGVPPGYNSVDGGFSTDTNSTMLYKFGQEAPGGRALTNPLMGSSARRLSGINTQMSATMPGTAENSELSDRIKEGGSIVSDSPTNAEFEDPHVKFLVGIEKNRNISQKTVSGSQFRMPAKGAARCENCENFNQQNKKMKEVIRSLKLQISRLEEKLHDLKMSKTSGDFAMPSGSFSGSSNENKVRDSVNNNENITNAIDLIRRCELLEEELAKNKKLVALERNSLEVLKKTHEDTKTSLNLDLLDRKNEIIALTKELNAFKELHRNQEGVIDHLNNTLLSYKQQLEKSENKLSDALIRLKASASSQATADVDNLRELERLRSELQKSEEANRALNNNLTVLSMNLSTAEGKLSKANSTIMDLEAQIEAGAAELARVNQSLGAAQEQVVSSKKRVEIMEITLKQVTAERDGFSNNLAVRESDLGIANQKIGMLESEIANLNRKMADLLKRMGAESENTKKALEKAISASVRLCVVAPTVNVHVADKKLKFKAGLSEANLQSFLTTEVLDKYSFLFKQRTDNTAPNGTDLETWLQKMLSQMQTSIESHVNAAMDGSSL